MNEKLSIISSVAVIAFILYLGWMLRDIDKDSIAKINNTLSTLSNSIGTTPTTVPDSSEKYILYGGLGILLIATVRALIKKG
jgi:hypothetical protein